VCVVEGGWGAAGEGGEGVGGCEEEDGAEAVVGLDGWPGGHVGGWVGFAIWEGWCGGGFWMEMVMVMKMRGWGFGCLFTGLAILGGIY